jgi:hypothetical protein
VRAVIFAGHSEYLDFLSNLKRRRRDLCKAAGFEGKAQALFKVVVPPKDSLLFGVAVDHDLIVDAGLTRFVFGRHCVQAFECGSEA